MVPGRPPKLVPADSVRRAGKWSAILADPKFGKVLANRSGTDCKVRQQAPPSDVLREHTLQLSVFVSPWRPAPTTAHDSDVAGWSRNLMCRCRSVRGAARGAEQSFCAGVTVAEVRHDR